MVSALATIFAAVFAFAAFAGAESVRKELVAAVEQAKNQPRPAAKPKNPNPTPKVGDL